MAMRLRNYQRITADRMLADAKAGRRALGVVPTGGGKSFVIAEACRRVREQGGRVWVITHTVEIVDQNVGHIRRMLPDELIRVDCNSLAQRKSERLRTTAAAIRVGSIQTMHGAQLGRPPALVIIDEAHAIQRTDESMYRMLLDNLPRSTKIAGLTATHFRLDSGYLHQGEGALFDRISHQVSAAELIARGWLVPIVGPDQLGLRMKRPAEIDDAAGALVKTRACLENAVNLLRRRRKSIVFCYSIDHAEEAAAYFSGLGRKTMVVHSRMSRTHSREVLAAFRMAPAADLFSVGMLTTGFDVPDITAIVLLRHTESVGLYIQMLGRGMRPSPGKTECLVLDYAGNHDRHGDIADPHVTIRGPWRGRDAVAREFLKACPACSNLLVQVASACDACGYEFIDLKPAPTRSLLDRRNAKSPTSRPVDRHIPASRAPLLATEEVAQMTGRKPAYIKSLRWTGKGPKFYCRHTMTRLGLKSIVYRIEDVEAWLADHPLAARREVDDVVPPSRDILLSTEEVAAVLDYKPQYIKQLRAQPYGPKFYRKPSMTRLGIKTIVYRIEDVEAWANAHPVISGPEAGQTKRRLNRDTVGLR